MPPVLCCVCAGKFLDVLQSTLECHQDEAVMQLAAEVVGHFLQGHSRDVLPGFFVDRLCTCIGRLLANTKSDKLTATLLSEFVACMHRAYMLYSRLIHLLWHYRFLY